MNMPANLQTDSSIKAAKDSVGGGYGPWDSDIYQTTVEMAYMEKANSGALGVHLTLKNAEGQTSRQIVYVTTGDSKGNRNYSERDGEKSYLPGFVLMNSLAVLTLNKELSQLTTEKKVIKVYSFEARSEVPAEKEVLVELLGKPVYSAVQKQIVDKKAKGDDGQYHPTGETREVNEIDKFFRASDRMTSAEILAGTETATFYDTWLAKWKGQVRDRAKGIAGGAAGAPPAAAGTSTAKPTTSLFGN